MIYLVDDNPYDRVVLSKLLEGHEQRWFNNAEQAWVGAEDQLPDILVTDQRLPGMSGLQLVKKITKELGRPRRIVVVTGAVETGLEEAKDDGTVDEVIRKGNTLAEVEAIRDRILELEAEAP